MLKLSKESYASIFHLVDSDGDGLISFREYLGALPIAKGKTQESRIKSALKVYQWAPHHAGKSFMPADRLAVLLEKAAGLYEITDDNQDKVLFTPEKIRAVVNKCMTCAGQVDVGAVADEVGAVAKTEASRSSWGSTIVNHRDVHGNIL